MSEPTVVILAIGATRPEDVEADARSLADRRGRVVIVTRRPAVFDELRELPGVEIVHVRGLDAARLLRIERRLLQNLPRRLYRASMQPLDGVRSAGSPMIAFVARILQGAIHRSYFAYVKVVRLGDRVAERYVLPRTAAVIAEAQAGRLAGSMIRNGHVVGLVSADLQSLRPAWFLAKTNPNLPVLVSADPDWLTEDAR